MWNKIDREDRIRAIREGVALGMSASQIAEWIGGATRNMVIGLAWRARVDLSPHHPGAHQTPAAERQFKDYPRPFKPKSPPKPEVPVVIEKEPEPELPDEHYRVHILDVMSGQCRFPQWPDKPKPKTESMFYCGRPVQNMSSYCPKCHKVVYTGMPMPSRKKKRLRLRGQFA